MASTLLAGSWAQSTPTLKLQPLGVIHGFIVILSLWACPVKKSSPHL